MESFLKSLDFHLIPQFDLDYSNWSEVNWFTSRAMSSMWGNFAKMGDPTPPGWSWHATCSSRTCNRLLPTFIAATPPPHQVHQPE